MKKLHYVFGDVHGNLKTLLLLLSKLPKNAIPIFVGDLIDRGPDSKGVIKLIKENNYKCVLGNHEEMMITSSDNVIDLILSNENGKLNNIRLFNLWLYNGGIEALSSYGLVEGNEYGLDIIFNEKTEDKIEDLKNDIEWFKTLPLFIELDIEGIERKIVISHANSSNVWDLKNDESIEKKSIFKDKLLWNRQYVKDNGKTFTIFGHTPKEFGPEIEEHYVNVDTGCFFKRHGYNKLSCYCIETKEVISVDNID